MDFRVNPADFRDDDELVAFILDSVIKPVIAKHVDVGGTPDGIQGVAYLFGGPASIPSELIERIHRLVGEGLSPDYVIREMTDLTIRRRKEITYGGFVVHYVEVELRNGDVAIPSPEELDAHFRL
jgi:hypothetical protein